MSTNDKSRSEYFRNRRQKNTPARNEAAERDAARKREKRGGYKNPSRQYQEYLAQLPDDAREIARIIHEHPHLVRGDVDLSKFATNNIRPISLTANARKRRFEEMQSYYQREELAAIDSNSDNELRDLAVRWAADRDPDLVVSEMRARADGLRICLNERRKNNAQKQAVYRANNIDKVREAEKLKTSKRRAVEKLARTCAPFVAIDAEGIDVGEPHSITPSAPKHFLDLGLPDQAADDPSLVLQDHRTFLWGAGSDNGRVEWLGGSDKVTLTGLQICTWLVSLVEKFPQSIFVMFAAGYDWTQIFRDMPYEKAWELWNALPWSEHELSTGEKPNRQRYMLWGDFALRLYPGKYIEIAQLRDRNAIKDEKGKFNFLRKIKIYDTFGFFQSSFLKAAGGFGGNFLSSQELHILEDGKSRRHEFTEFPLPKIMRYTLVELRRLLVSFHIVIAPARKKSRCACQ